MKITTKAYSIPPEMIREIRANPEKLENLLDVSDQHHPDWRVEDYNFAASWDETVKLLNERSFERAWEKLNTENYLETRDNRAWTATPSAVKSAAKDLESVNVEEMKEFFKNTAERGNYLLFITN